MNIPDPYASKMGGGGSDREVTRGNRARWRPRGAATQEWRPIEGVMGGWEWEPYEDVGHQMGAGARW